MAVEVTPPRPISRCPTSGVHLLPDRMQYQPASTHDVAALVEWAVVARLHKCDECSQVGRGVAAFESRGVAVGIAVATWLSQVGMLQGAVGEPVVANGADYFEDGLGMLTRRFLERIPIEPERSEVNGIDYGFPRIEELEALVPALSDPARLEVWDDAIGGMAGAMLARAMLEHGAFVCPDCLRFSYHPKDMENQYCSACKKFFEGQYEAPQQ